jgi:hypothetical protein
VECATGNTLNTKFAEPTSHFTRRFDGERKCENFFCNVDAGLDAVGDAMSDGSSFSGASARKDPDRTDERERDLPLVFVERFNECAHRVPLAWQT